MLEQKLYFLISASKSKTQQKLTFQSTKPEIKTCYFFPFSNIFYVWFKILKKWATNISFQYFIHHLIQKIHMYLLTYLNQKIKFCDVKKQFKKHFLFCETKLLFSQFYLKITVTFFDPVYLCWEKLKLPKKIFMKRRKLYIFQNWWKFP